MSKRTDFRDGKMKYTNNEIFKRTRKAKVDLKSLTHITNKSNLSLEDKMKMSLCRHFVQFINTRRLKLKEMSELMDDIAVPRLSEIVNYKINKFTVDQLIKNLSLLAKHDAQIKEYLVFLEQATELPTLAVAHTRRLTKNIRAASAEHTNHN